MLRDLYRDILPRLEALRDALAAERRVLEREPRSRVWRAVLPELPAMLERHQAGTDTAPAPQEASSLFNAVFGNECRTALQAYELEPVPQLQPDDLAQCEACESTGRADEDEDDAPQFCAADAFTPVSGGASYARLHAALKLSIRSRLNELAAQAVRQCMQKLDAMRDALIALAPVYRDELNAAKRAIQAE